jgi:flavorubredoxin
MTAGGTLRARQVIGDGLPRLLAPGTYWLGDCILMPPLPDGTIEHSYSSTYLVHGDEHSLLVDTGHPKDWPVVAGQLDDLLANVAPPLRWIFPTHPEVTHSGNLGRLLAKFPDAEACGDMRDYHLLFPSFIDRFVPMTLGDELELGNRTIVFVEAVFRDLVSTLWAYDRRERVIFTGDGLGFGHHHETDECGKLAEETPDLPIPELTGIFLEYALYWSRLKDVEPHIRRLDELLTVDFPVEIVASSHGSPVTSLEATMPKIRQGVRQLAERYSLR